MAAIRILACAVVLGSVLGGSVRGAAADVNGKLTLTGTAGKPPLRGKAFLDRVENPYLGGKNLDPMPYMVVVLEKDGATLPTPPQVKWKLLGESFDKPILPVLAGSEVVIQNNGRRAPTLYVEGHDDLIARTPLNKDGERAFKATEAGSLLVVRDEDTPHLTGSVLVLGSPYFAVPASVGEARTEGKFSIAGVADGEYTVKIWYRTGWLEGIDTKITVEKGAAKDPVAITLPPGLSIAGAGEDTEK
jgi:hypothetical protein